MDDREKFIRMTTEPVGRLIGRMAVPTMVSMLITSIYNMADTFFVGLLDNTSATGAVGVVFSLMAIIQACAFLFGQGSGNYISRMLGQQRRPQAERMVTVAFFSAIGVGLLIAALGLVFLEPLARLLGSTETILPYAREYLRIILLGAPWMIGALVLNNRYRHRWGVERDSRPGVHFRAGYGGDRGGAGHGGEPGGELCATAGGHHPAG